MDQTEYPQIYPKPGWVEHNPAEIWQSQQTVLYNVLREQDIKAEQIRAIGITNQRETTVVWERETGRPIYNAIVWQCRRTSGMVEELYRQGKDKYIQEVTGLVPDAYFSATKIRWILDNVPGAQQRADAGELCAGTVDSWLIWNFTKGKQHVTDRTNASRTMLYNIYTLEWDKTLLELFNIPESMLPKVNDSSALFGMATIDGVEIPIAGVAGDQQASLVGQTCFHKGEAKNTYGTGCFILMNTGDAPVKSKNGLLTTIAYSLDGKVTYALEGSVFNTGSVVQWLRDEVGILESSSDIGRISAEIDGTGGVYLVPAFTGLGAPYWDMNARGCLIGVTRGTNRKHIIRAAEESTAYQVRDVILVMEEDIGREIPLLRVDGGGSKDDFLLQFQADIMDAVIQRGSTSESSALGVAFLAGLAVSFWESIQDIQKDCYFEREFMPSMPKYQRDELNHGWKRAVERSLGWIEEP